MQKVNITAKTIYCIACIIFAVIFGMSVVQGQSQSGFWFQHSIMAGAAVVSAVSMLLIDKRIAKFSLAGSSLLLLLITSATSMKIFYYALWGTDSNIGTYSPSASEIVLYLATPVLFISAFVFSLLQLVHCHRNPDLP